jgi:hypothetical protein
VSGINLSPNLTTEELLPTQLANKALNEEKVYTHPGWGMRNFVEYNYMKTSAHYDGIIIEIIKADNEDEANLFFEMTYDHEDFFDDSSGSRSKSKTSWWFIYEASGISGFYWKSGVWVLGVEAKNSEIRNQATIEFVQELRGFS